MKMFLGITGFLDFVPPPVFQTLKTTTFQKLDLFPFSSEGAGDTYSVGPL
jgi:hypothetical protein